MDILEFTRYIGKKQRHYFGIYPWHHQGGELGAVGTDSFTLLDLRHIIATAALTDDCNAVCNMEKNSQNLLWIHCYIWQCDYTIHNFGYISV